ncbi:MAG: HD domain-containing protein [Planctomycetes bacterium]|nr:HD domain-containing protein [Planctomycetota bacterium]
MRTPSARDLRAHAVLTFAHALVIGALNRRMHDRDSRHVHDALADLVTALRRAATLGVDMPLQLQCADDRICHDGESLDGPSLQARSLLRDLRQRGIAMLSFGPRLDVEEANRLYDLLLLDDNVAAFARSTRDAALAAFGVRNVRVSLRAAADPSDRRCGVDGTDRALHQYQDLADCLQQTHARALRDQELAVHAAANVVERAVTGMDEPSLLLSLAAQDDVDRFTVGHSVRVALLALQVARAVGATREQSVQVGSAALLHDIGKSKVPQEVLFKQGRLTADEWHWMQQHPRLGAQILLEQHEHVAAGTICAAFCHHMRPDGKGYPESLVSVAPGGTSRLVRVCDVFEALTSIRPYKRALTPIEAYAVMFRNERDFDVQWLRVFARTIGLFPNGTRVRLRSGAAAVVREQTGCPEKPIVQLLTGPDDSALPPGQPDRFRIGDLCEGKPMAIHAVDTHDRCITVPDFDPKDLALPTHACLSPALVHDLTATPAKG